MKTADAEDMSCHGCHANIGEDSVSFTLNAIVTEMLTDTYAALVFCVHNLSDFFYEQYRHLVSDVFGLDDQLLLDYITLLYWPILIFFVLPAIILVSLYASSLFLTIYKWRSQLQEAYHHNFWDAARETLAVLWDAKASFWHGYEIDGLENIPDEGPALLIYYHGALPLDIYYIIAKLYLHKKRVLHNVGDRFLTHIPGFQTLMTVFNVKPGTVESCVSLLKQGEIITLSPGGVREALFSQDYELLWNGRKGFAKVALASGAPIIPVFTKNIRQAFNTLSIGNSIFKYLYENYKIPLGLYYGGFPVKLKTFIGKPIRITDENQTPEHLAEQVSAAVSQLIKEHQRQPPSILMALLDRFLH